MPDETTLVPLNTVDAVATQDKNEQQQRGYCFHCGKYGHYNAQCRRLRKNAITQQKRVPLTQTKLKHQNPSATRADKTNGQN